jgi:3-phenylpropionate/cinnamic acid dioxygenase small subunit
MSSRLQELLDRYDIERLCTEYATALDERNWERLAACFEETGKLHTSLPEQSLRGRSEIARRMSAMAELHGGVQHFVANFQYSVQQDTASGSCSFLAYRWRGQPDSPTHSLVMGGSYRDLLRRGPDGWLFEERHIIGHWHRRWVAPNS